MNAFTSSLLESAVGAENLTGAFLDVLEPNNSREASAGLVKLLQAKLRGVQVNEGTIMAGMRPFRDEDGDDADAMADRDREFAKTAFDLWQNLAEYDAGWLHD